MGTGWSSLQHPCGGSPNFPPRLHYFRSISKLDQAMACPCSAAFGEGGGDLQRLHVDDCIQELFIHPGALLYPTIGRGIGTLSVPFAIGGIKRADVYVPIFINYRDPPPNLIPFRRSPSVVLSTNFLFFRYRQVVLPKPCAFPFKQSPDHVAVSSG